MFKTGKCLCPLATVSQQDSTERASNKLTRTFTTRMEALKRYRIGGQQKVVVEHVTVNARSGAASKTEGQPHAKALSFAPAAQLWSEDPEQELLPLACNAER